MSFLLLGKPVTDLSCELTGPQVDFFVFFKRKIYKKKKKKKRGGGGVVVSVKGSQKRRGRRFCMSPPKGNVSSKRDPV